MTLSNFEFYDDPDLEGLTIEQKENLFLLEVFESALCELLGDANDCPTEQQILDHLFKGQRRSKEVRRLEERLIALLEKEKRQMLGLLLDLKTPEH